MKKLKLESLEVTSFETAAADSRARGTVEGNSVVSAPPSVIEYECNPTDTRMDCTYGCSYDTGCVVGCGFTEGPDCVPTSIC
ncbi:MAG TPA: pinensin family lanthipeptide [Longimicrobium sp.]|nr:pinensin family lanthipeptide [Longimicrobium sp.]